VSIEYEAKRLRCFQSGVATALFAAALSLLSVHAIAAETITVDGNRRIDAETVRSYFHASPDGRYDDAARDAALKSLIATNLFDNVRIERTQSGLIVHVAEAKVLGRVAFEGKRR
jgi:outer membrane protein insertion porin family